MAGWRFARGLRAQRALTAAVAALFGVAQATTGSCALWGEEPPLGAEQRVTTPGADLLKAAPRDWVVDASNNEIKGVRHENSYLRYLVLTSDHQGERLRDTIETRDGPVARLIRKNGRALTSEEDEAERSRLGGLLSSPSAFARHQKDGDEGKKLAIDLIRLLPDAMTFTYAPGQPQLPGAAGPQVVIDYAPKAGWDPPTTISAGLKGLRGRAWIDGRSRYVVRMEGEIFQGVNFGWGMLAHVYAGGKLYLEQTRVRAEQDPAHERWIFTRFNDDLKVRAVMLKTLSIRTDIQTSRYQILSKPPTYQEPIRMLLDTPLPQ